MKVAYFDCSSGICGSMIVGALLDAGLDLAKLQSGLARLELPELSISVRKVLRQSLSGSLFRVHEGDRDEPVDDLQVRPLERAPGHALRRVQEVGHVHRNLHDIESILGRSRLAPDEIKEAMRIFTRLATAEAAVHGTTVSEIHFHEVGALDAIADIVCAVLARRLWGIERVCASPVAVGNGTVRCQHGTLSVPAPATVQLLKGVPLQAHAAQTELTTPTGAAILTEWTREFGPLPSLTVEAIGYGAGEKDMPHPNLLRVLIGEMATSSGTWECDTVIQIETHLDDMSPEDLPTAIERILEAGALDAVLSPIVLKKGRSGQILTALSPENRLNSVASAIFQHTSAIGFRHFPVARRKLRRSDDVIETAYGPVSGKRVERSSGQFTFKPDFDVCQKLARKNGSSVQAVRLAAEVAWNSLRSKP